MSETSGNPQRAGSTCQMRTLAVRITDAECQWEEERVILMRVASSSSGMKKPL
ncbi:hypothetical protein [Alpinimonas psychrophila]|uniref:Uncharacterized protein n=1 Tax=Alpinimonas psychrophila TaxID=748908 RepID=A0A7W3PNS3_9MICO|nr:hypothetical protein [Alpinimonas psychrophila]MBA8828720.1 hypothetical protein [Alpinimonas psychrophila]